MKARYLIPIFLFLFTIPVIDTFAQVSEAEKNKARVYGLHMIDLKPGVTGEQFEDFFANRYLPLWNAPGWTIRLLKGDRGDRAGRYLVMYEIETMDVRDQLAPESNVFVEDFYDKHFKVLEGVAEEWRKLALFPSESTIYTDYYVVAGSN